MPVPGRQIGVAKNPSSQVSAPEGDNAAVTSSNSNLSIEIARTAARLVVEEGAEIGRAKRQALNELGAPQRTPLPDNATVEEAIREHIALFFADTQPAELRALRELALVWMERLGAFRPHLSGAVWNGTATQHSDIYLQLFCDDPKSAELTLIDKNVQYTTSTVRGLHGRPVDTLSIAAMPLHPDAKHAERVGVHVLVYDHDDLRGALRHGSDGRSPRGDTSAVRALFLESSRDGY